VKRFFAVATLLLLVLSTTVTAFARETIDFIPFKTYTICYSSAYPLESPAVYLPNRIITGEDLGIGSLHMPGDIFVDSQMGITIADTGNNRIIRLNQDWTLNHIIDYVPGETPNSLSAPQGVFVTHTGYLFIADTNNGRILEYDPYGNFIRSIGEPYTGLLDEDFVYRPTALVVDRTGRIYVVASGAYMGIMQLSGQGVFEGFVGAQRVSFNMLDYLWRIIMTREQRARLRMFVPTEYNNIAIDDQGFIFVTSSAITETDIVNEIITGDSRLTPVRRLNPAGHDVMRRGGLPIVGDMFWTHSTTAARTGPSVFSDIALGEHGTFTVLDSNRNRFFTYNALGQLLYVFGTFGVQAGAMNAISAITYHGTDFIALDPIMNSITVFTRTSYGDLIFDALGHYANFDYDAAIEIWRQVIAYNSTFTMAYASIAHAYLDTGDYTQAMSYFRLAIDQTGYSVAFRYWRSQTIERLVFLFLLILVAGIYGIRRFQKWIKGRNRDEKYLGKREGFINTLTYSYHVMFRPFDGFWDLRHEKRGSLAAANTILALACITLVFQALFTSFAFMGVNYFYMADLSIINTAMQIVLPLLLWTLANWCVTTLMDGVGNMRHIYIATCYALLPFVIFTTIGTLLTHVLAIHESAFVNIAYTIGFGWTFMLIYIGNMVTHQYTVAKSVVAAILTVFGIGIIVFIFLLFGVTIGDIVLLVQEIWLEVSLRF